MKEQTHKEQNPGRTSTVMYCLVGRMNDDGAAEYLLMQKQGALSFPATKLRQGEGLYEALARPIEDDLGLPAGSYFPEEELQAIRNAASSRAYDGLPREWHLYPVVVSLTAEAWAALASRGEGVVWRTLDAILADDPEPNVRAVAAWVAEHRGDLVAQAPAGPSMDAMASRWAAANDGGVRVARGDEIRSILASGSRAFNLRVADPYLPYQKQGLGFTWSFFTPKDRQDVHVHGLPAVEIYGVLEGRLQLWSKPMNRRGVLTWHPRILYSGDWAEVDPLHCHFACWLDAEGLGTVVKAAASGELAGVGKLGVSGKTRCDACNVHQQCLIPEPMQVLIDEYGKDFSSVTTFVSPPWRNVRRGASTWGVTDDERSEGGREAGEDRGEG